MTCIYLALSSNSNAQRAVRDYPWEGSWLGVLVSMEYLKVAEETLGVVAGRTRLMLDSGAYSAWNAGRSVDINALIDEGSKPRWTEVVALDVIGNSDASVQNALKMKKAGSRAFPVFHYGDPWEHLALYRTHFPKVGLSCLLGEPMNLSRRWLDQCFARAWPHRFHSFGWVSERLLMGYPFHSADSSSWELGPTAFGHWTGFGNLQLSIPNGKISKMPGGLVTQVRVVERLAQKVRGRWASEFRKQGWT